MKKKVLIVEDENDICALLSTILKEQGYSVECCNTLTDAKKMINSAKPEIVILDINLPDGNGLDSIPELRELKSDLSFIVISAYDSAEEISKADSFDVALFLKKPFNKTELLNAIQL